MNPEQTRVWFRQVILDWAEINLRDFAWRHTCDPYAIFVAEFLLQQTDAPRVVPVYERFIEKYPTLASLADAPQAAVVELLHPLGFHFRARRLHRIAQLLIADSTNAGRIPANEDELLRLPGVGPYVARSVCSNAFHQSLAIIDTNVSRIIMRFFGFSTSRARPRNDPMLWAFAQQIAPSFDVPHWNLALLDFGALTCTARNPRCSDCPLVANCCYKSDLITNGRGSPAK